MLTREALHGITDRLKAQRDEMIAELADVTRDLRTLTMIEDTFSTFIAAGPPMTEWVEDWVLNLARNVWPAGPRAN